MKNLKKTFAALLSLVMLITILPAQILVLAEEPAAGEFTAVLSYDASAAEGEEGYVALDASNNVASPANYGIKVNTASVIWGLSVENAIGRSSFRFSPRAANGDAAKTYGEFVFAEDTNNGFAALDDPKAIYMLEMELSSILRPSGGKAGSYCYTLTGLGADGQIHDAVKVLMSGTGTEGTLTAEGAAGAAPIEKVRLSNPNGLGTGWGPGDPAALYYIRVYVNMEAQTYSVWAIERASRDNPYSEAEPSAAEHLIVKDAPLTDEIVQLHGVRFSAANHVAGDKLNLTFLRISKADAELELPETDADRVAADSAALDLGDLSNVTGDLTLPAIGAVNQSEITWSSSAPGVISNSGAVTRQKEDAAVTLTATITSGSASATKEFTVTVKGTGDVPGDSDALVSYTSEEGMPGYVDTGKIGERGISITNCWSFAYENTCGGIPAMRFSANAANAGATKQYGKFEFDKDTLLSPPALNDPQGIYVLEMEFSAVVRGQGGNAGAWFYTVQGKNAAGQEAEIAKFSMSGKGTGGTMTAEGADGANAVGVILAGSQAGGSGWSASDPGALYCLRVAVNMESKTYSAWVIERRTPEMEYTEKEPDGEDLIVSDQPFTSRDITQLTGLTLSAYNNASSDRTNVKSLRVAAMDDRTLVENAAAALTADFVKGENPSLDKVTLDLQMPAKYRNTNIRWEIDAELAGYLTADGVVTPLGKYNDPITARIRAVISKGAAEAITKEFTVTLEPTDGKSQGTITAAPGNIVNQAKGVDAAGSTQYNDSFAADKAVDGDTGTRWATPDADENHVDYVIFDFNKQAKIEEFFIDEFIQGTVKRTAHCTVELSDNGTDWTRTDLAFQEGSISGQHRTFRLNLNQPAEARYFKLSFIKNAGMASGVSVWEIQAFCGGDDDRTVIETADELLDPEAWLDGNAGVKEVVSDMQLPAESNGLQITWRSNKPGVISPDGKVTRPLSADEKVTLTAEFRTTPNQTYTCTHSFPFVVLTYTVPERNAIMDQIADEIRTGIVNKNASLDQVDSALKLSGWELAEQYSCDAAFTADAALAAVIDLETGEVSRPVGAPTAGTLTVTLRNNVFAEEFNRTFDIPVTVLGLTAGNLAYGQRVSSNALTLVENAPENAVDERAETKWFTDEPDALPSLTVNLGTVRQISRAELWEAPDHGRYTVKEAVIEVSTNGKDYAVAAVVSGIGAHRAVDFLPVKAKYVQYRVTQKEEGNTGLFEYKIFDAPTDANRVAADKAAFRWPLPSVVSREIELPAAVEGGQGSVLSWSSSSDSAFAITAKDGKITGVPKQANNSQRVTVTVTFKNGSAEDTMSGVITIPGKSGGTPGGSGGASSGGASPGGNRGSGSSSGGGTPAFVPAETGGQEKEAVSPYLDVRLSDWSYPYIVRLTEQNIVGGDGTGRFYPQTAVTREELVKMILASLEIQPSEAESGFADVEAGMWYSGYVAAAAESGIVKGVDAGTFGVGAAVTRQDMVTMICRAFAAAGQKLPAAGGIEAFADAELIEDYARDAVAALTGQGIISGADGQFLPRASATRAECAKVICMMLDQINQ